MMTSEPLQIIILLLLFVCKYFYIKHYKNTVHFPIRSNNRDHWLFLFKKYLHGLQFCYNIIRDYTILLILGIYTLFQCFSDRLDLMLHGGCRQFIWRLVLRSILWIADRALYRLYIM